MADNEFENQVRQTVGEVRDAAKTQADQLTSVGQNIAAQVKNDTADVKSDAVSAGAQFQQVQQNAAQGAAQAAGNAQNMAQNAAQGAAQAAGNAQNMAQNSVHPAQQTYGQAGHAYIPVSGYPQQGQTSNQNYWQTAGQVFGQSSGQPGADQNSWTQNPSGQNPAGQNPYMNNYQAGYHSSSTAQTDYQAQRAANGYNPVNGQMTQTQPKETLAIVGMILGIAGLILSCVPVLGVLLCIGGVVCSIIALTKHQKKAMWLTGIITGAIGIVLAILVMVAAAMFIRMIPSIFQRFYGQYGSSYSQNDSDLSGIEDWIQQYENGTTFK